MRRNWVTKFRQGLLLTALAGAGIGLVGCADEYAAYPGYHGGYYASYSSPYPYSGGYGYPYRAYGPYYGRPYGYGYGYGGPYYGGSSVVVSRSSSSYRYRDQNGRWHDRRGVNRNTNRVRSTSRATTRTRTPLPRSENDDEQRYYGPRTN